MFTVDLDYVKTDIGQDGTDDFAGIGFESGFLEGIRFGAFTEPSDYAAIFLRLDIVGIVRCKFRKILAAIDAEAGR